MRSHKGKAGTLGPPDSKLHGASTMPVSKQTAHLVKLEEASGDVNSFKCLITDYTSETV